MSVLVIAFECYENDFMHYPVEVALLNITEGFCYTYHINYSPDLMDRHPQMARKNFAEHGLAITTGDFKFDWAMENMLEHVNEGCGCRNILYVYNPAHKYRAEQYFRCHQVLECPPLPHGDDTHHDETCALHKQRDPKFSCARRRCFQAAAVIKKLRNV